MSAHCAAGSCCLGASSRRHLVRRFLLVRGDALPGHAEETPRAWRYGRCSLVRVCASLGVSEVGVRVLPHHRLAFSRMQEGERSRRLMQRRMLRSVFESSAPLDSTSRRTRAPRTSPPAPSFAGVGRNGGGAMFPGCGVRDRGGQGRDAPAGLVGVGQ